MNKTHSISAMLLNRHTQLIEANAGSASKQGIHRRLRPVKKHAPAAPDLQQESKQWTRKSIIQTRKHIIKMVFPTNIRSNKWKRFDEVPSIFFPLPGPAAYIRISSTVQPRIIIIII